MALGDAINSEMATTLLRKIKGQEPIPNKESDLKKDSQVISSKLEMLTESLKVDSKEAKERRKVLIEELMEEFEKEGLTLKEQKDILENMDESIKDSLPILQSFKKSNIAKFFTTISNPKLFSEVINKSLSKSHIGKVVDMIPKMITKVSNGFTKVFSWIGKAFTFLQDPIGHLKALGEKIIQKTVNFITESFQKLTVFMWKNVIRPVLIGIGRLAARILAFGFQLTELIVSTGLRIIFFLITTTLQIAFSIIGFIMFTVVPILFTIFTTIMGFLIFTVVPMMFSVLTAIAGAVVTVLAAITPVLLVATAVLLIGILLGYLLYKAYLLVKDFVKYIFSSEFIDDVIEAAKTAMNWVWVNVISPAWDLLKEAFQLAWDGIVSVVDGIKNFFVEEVWGNLISPAINWLWDNILEPVWSTVIAPVFDFIQNVFIEGWYLLLDTIDVIKDLIESVIGGVSKIGEGIGSIASSVWDGVSTAWTWTTSWFAKGGIVTKPTNAVIGEGGVSEAVIPLDKKGMQFIRESFQIDELALSKIIDNSDLFKSQMKIQTTLNLLSKEVAKIKFIVSEKKTENKIQNPPEVLVQTIKIDRLPEVTDIAAVFDPEKLRKLIEDSDGNILKKIEELMVLLQTMSESSKVDPLINPGTAISDSYHDLLKSISTGIIGVRQ